MADPSAQDANPLNRTRLEALRRTYCDGLLKDVLPFWLTHAVDRDFGGYMTCLNRDGSLLDTDKSIWAQGRFAWLLATLYDQVEQREEWLENARSGIDFLRSYAFDDDGRMFFTVTRDGRPLRKRRYVFSEAFGVAALAAYAKAAGDERARDEAENLFRLMIRYLTTPGLLPSKNIPGTRPTKGLAVPMILIVTAQILRHVAKDQAFCNEWIMRSIEEIERDFLHPEWRAVLESVGLDGRFVDHLDGRMLNPGHAIEAAWFIMQEATLQNNDAHLLKLGTTILDWMWQWGWDEEYGGIFYYRDVKNLPVQEYWQDMKFWWPQNEAIIATLMAYSLTKDVKYALWHTQAHDWAYSHFPDSEYGEWFGYLHRKGSVAQSAKGNIWKGLFHLPRMQLLGWQITDGLLPR